MDTKNSFISKINMDNSIKTSPNKVSENSSELCSSGRNLQNTNTRKVHFNQKKTIKYFNKNSDSEIEDKNSDSEIEDNHLIIDKDPTDIYDENEKEIVEDSDNSDDETNKHKHHELIKNVKNMFFNKYEHLDNYKNKKIIYELCKILVDKIPEFANNPIAYLNTLESSIKEISNPTLENISQNNILNDN
jgi:hypothetical protein